ncbi:MAG: dynamin family protein [Planctomycetes bacterium]|nr:dynamin family protein [Planctomycetota bacterium]
MIAQDPATLELARRASSLGAALQRALAAHAALPASLRAQVLAEEELADLAALQGELSGLERRAGASGALEVGIIGQLNAGKSTLLNALLGRSVSPTSALPATGVFLRLDPRARAPRVVFLPELRRRPLALTQLEAVARWITHDGNPRNRDGVDCVELPCEATLLGAEVGITDTPGEGDVLQGEPERLQRYLDERLDLAVLVGSNTSLWTRASFDLLERALRRCPLVLLVANVDAGARGLDLQGAEIEARDDDALRARLAERLAESPRAPRSLADGSLRVHVFSARAALAGDGADRAALDALRAELRSAVSDAGFQRRRRSVLAANLDAAEHALREHIATARARVEEERARRAAAIAAAAEESARERAHRERAQRELASRAEDLVRGAAAAARELWEGELSAHVLRCVRAWRVRPDAAEVLREELERELAAGARSLDARGAAMLDEARRFAVLLGAPSEALPAIAPLSSAPLAPLEVLLGSPKFSGRFWLGLPFGLLAGWLAAGPATRAIEAQLELPIAGPLLGMILGVLASLLVGLAIGALAGAYAWRRLLRAGLPVLLKRALVSRVDERKLRPLGAELARRASARAEQRAEGLRALAQSFAEERSADPRRASEDAASERALAALAAALEEVATC